MAKVAVITGSNGLMGQATCRCLAQSGHPSALMSALRAPATGRTTSAI